MEEALRALLVANGGVSALVPATSIVWGQRIGAPAISLHLISGRPGMTMGGPSGLTDYLVQLDCWATKYDLARVIADAAIAVLHGHRDEVLTGVFVEAERSDFEMADAPPAKGQPANIQSISLDLRVWHRNP